MHLLCFFLIITSHYPVLGHSPGPRPGPGSVLGPSPGPKLVPVFGPGPVIFLVQALVPVLVSKIFQTLLIPGQEKPTHRLKQE